VWLCWSTPLICHYARYITSARAQARPPRGLLYVLTREVLRAQGQAPPAKGSPECESLQKPGFMPLSVRGDLRPNGDSTEGVHEPTRSGAHPHRGRESGPPR
jgi:hypothetical protein